MRKNLFLAILLLPAFCFVSCNDIDETLISRGEEQADEFSDDTILVSEKAASDHFNVLEFKGFLLTRVETKEKQTYSDGSMSIIFGRLFDFDYITPKALNRISIASDWKRYATKKFTLNYQEPAIDFDNGNYYDISIDYTPEGYIASMGMKEYIVLSGNTYASSHIYTYSYSFSYDEEGRLIEFDKTILEDESTYSDYGDSKYKKTTDTKTTLTWEDENMTRVFITTHYSIEDLIENTIRENDYVSDYAITYSEDENPGRQYCLALSSLIMDNYILIPCMQIGLYGTGTLNVPVNISGINSGKEFNREITLTYNKDVNGNLLIEKEQWSDENTNKNDYKIYNYQYTKLVNSQVPKIYDN